MTEEPVPSEDNVQTGSIQSVDLELYRMTLLLENGEILNVNVDELLTEVTVAGSPGTLQDLQAGDVVEVTVNEATGVASSITEGGNI